MNALEYFRLLWRPTQEDRRTGKTTRLVDKLIQDLFTNGHIVVAGDYPQDHLWSTIEHRLHSEHQGIISLLIFDKGKATITIMSREQYAAKTKQ